MDIDIRIDLRGRRRELKYEAPHEFQELKAIECFWPSIASLSQSFHGGLTFNESNRFLSESSIPCVFLHIIFTEEDVSDDVVLRRSAGRLAASTAAVTLAAEFEGSGIDGH